MMARHPATPAEVTALMGFLAPLPAERREACVRFLTEQIATCTVCHAPIRRSDPRRIAEGDQDEPVLVHSPCGGPK